MVNLGHLMKPNLDSKDNNLGNRFWRRPAPFSLHCLFLGLRIEPRVFSMLDKNATSEPGPQTPGELIACCVGLKDRDGLNSDHYILPGLVNKHFFHHNCVSDGGGTSCVSDGGDTMSPQPQDSSL